MIINYEKKGKKNFLTSFGFLAKKKKPDEEISSPTMV
jgi:hypothetical protein